MRAFRAMLVVLVAMAVVIAVVVLARPHAIPTFGSTQVILATETASLAPGTENAELTRSPTPMREAGYTRSTSTPGAAGSASPESDTPTFDPDDLLTPHSPSTETATPAPLTGLGEGIELRVIQLRRILQPDGVVILADILNPTDRPARDVTLVFTRASGERVGEPQDLDLDLGANEASPGATELLLLADPIVAGWGDLQIHAIGAPDEAGTLRPGYLEVGYPEVSVDRTTLYYRVAVRNTGESEVSVPHQSLAFFAGDGSLLLVWKLGSHEALPPGGSYDLAGQIPLNQGVAEGYSLQEFSDVLAVLSAELAA